MILKIIIQLINLIKIILIKSKMNLINFNKNKIYTRLKIEKKPNLRTNNLQFRN